MPEQEKKPTQNIFEILLREMSLLFDPDTLSFILKFPSFSIPLDSEKLKSIRQSAKDQPEHIISFKTDDFQSLIGKKKMEFEKNLGKDQEISDEMEEVEFEDFDLEDLDTEVKPARVKISLKAFIKLTLHALKYANPKVPRKKWVEVIGLLTGFIEKKDTPLACLVIKDAYPIGHGTDVNAQIQNPQSMVRVYNEIRSTKSQKGQLILGWYHSHPSYGAFMSKTDYLTQVRYQKLGTKNSQLTAPIALVIDPTRISKRSYGFKIFRLKNDLKTWEEPRFEVLNCPLVSLPEMIEAMLPLTEEKGRMFLEYDHE